MPGIKDFKSKIVVITGAASGIGKAAAKAFASEGADLVIADNDAQRLEDAAKEIKACGATVLAQQVDVSKRKEVESFAELVIRERGHVDILINNAGVGVGGSLLDTNIEDFEWIFSINYWGVVYGLKAFLPYMVARKYGHVVNTASGAGLCSMASMSAYCSTKFAVVGLSETLRAEMRRFGIGVSTICPGIINTNIVAESRMHLPEGFRANRNRLVDFYRRFGWPPERVAKSILSAVRHNRSIVPVGPEAWAQWFTKRISQKFFDAMNEVSGRFLMSSK
ncbi:MAG: oxidoreductase [Deltaproteobacteria bacterium HGW-Deltaproteobacteria-13]|jgi:NAD(P)-dependent dehydrogenase (short-subunit alcohol dehydrogenase family)|nr:MAG: oxidoreductase [Deltaproteobacteria bacterium HGW-Deltaproteobacteria-13]